MKARYVVLRHSGIPEPHYDLMFDLAADEKLITWRCPIWPLDRPATLTRLPDHRREYLTYEGEIGGNRGKVARVDAGGCDVNTAAEEWTVHMAAGELRIMRIVADQWRASLVRNAK